MNYDATWIGIGIKGGFMLGFGGAESVGGYFYNLGNPSRPRSFSLNSSRWGFGLGAGGNLVCYCVFKLNSLYWLNDKLVEDWGVNVDGGAKFKHMAKVLKGKQFYENVKLAWALKNIGANLEKLRDSLHYIYQVHDFDANGDHPIISFEIPFAGTGLELSAFYTRGKMYIDVD